MMNAYTTKHFDKQMKKANVSDQDLLNALEEIEAGNHDGDLGGNLFKKRLAIKGQGKSGSYRLIVAKGQNGWFLTAYKKSNKANLTQSEKRVWKTVAKELGNLTDEQIQEGLRQREWRKL